MTDLRFEFRLLTDADLDMMHAWLNEPGVVRWWEGDDVSLPAVRADYGSAREDQETEHWIAQLDGAPVGWICCWPVLSDLSEAGAWLDHGLADTAAGIDYLLADPSRRGQGIGSAMIRAFAYDVVFGEHPDWTHVAASPYAANVASCRALERAGFDFVASIQYPDDEEEGPCSLLVMERPSST